MRVSFSAIGVAILLVGSVQSASAGFTIYNSQSSFLAAATVSTETFTNPFTPTGSQFNYTADFDGFSIFAPTAVPPGWSTGFNDVTGASSMMFGYATPGNSPNTQFITVTLDSPVTAFGLFVSDFGNFGATQFLVQIGGSSFVAATNDPAVNPFGIPTFFFGVTSTEPFSTVQLRSNAGGDIILLDDLSFGSAAASAVPAPPAALLGLMGVVGLGAGGWFKRRFGLNRSVPGHWLGT